MNKEREKEILKILLAEKRVYVKNLAERTYASEPSIRRDLVSLERQGYLRRVHGGAVIEETNNSEMKIPFVLRELEQSDAKITIAQKAASLVRDGSVIMLDASSSAYNMIPFLSRFANLTVITNGVKALTALSEYNITAFSTGGKLIPSLLSLTGDDALTTIARYNADFVFFSCRGLSDKGMATDFSIEENIIRRKMLTHAKTKVLLLDDSKFNREYMHNLCSVGDLDYVISNAPLPASVGNFVKSL